MAEIELGNAVEKIFQGLSLARQGKGAIATENSPVVNVSDLAEGVLPPVELMHNLALPNTFQLERFRLKAGDVLVSARGSIKVAGVRTEHVNAIAGPNLIIVRPGKIILPPLILAFLRHSSTVAKLERLSVGTTVRSLNVSTIARLPILVPPLERQSRIAILIETADAYYIASRRAADLRRQLAANAAMEAMSR